MRKFLERIGITPKNQQVSETHTKAKRVHLMERRKFIKVCGISVAMAGGCMDVVTGNRKEGISIPPIRPDLPASTVLAQIPIAPVPRQGRGQYGVYPRLKIQRLNPYGPKGLKDSFFGTYRAWFPIPNVGKSAWATARVTNTGSAPAMSPIIELHESCYIDHRDDSDGEWLSWDRVQAQKEETIGAQEGDSLRQRVQLPVIYPGRWIDVPLLYKRCYHVGQAVCICFDPMTDGPFFPTGVGFYAQDRKNVGGPNNETVVYGNGVFRCQY